MTVCTLKSVQISVEFMDEIENCTFNIRDYGGKIMDNEAIIRYKFYLCRNFLDKLLSENLVTEVQRGKIESAVIKRLSEI